MKANKTTVLVGKKVVLVPYGSEHVPKYHSWMLDEELRELTASEPLTLEEEYVMQQKWQLDEDKLTFIILSQHPGDHYLLHSSHSEHPPGIPVTSVIPTDPRISTLPMIGDVNLFLKGTPPRLRSTYTPEISASTLPDRIVEPEEEGSFEAEVEIMIAEPSYRRQGYAVEALQLMLGYATGSPNGIFPSASVDNPPTQSSLAQPSRSSPEDSPLPIPPTSLLTRISESNIPSITLFEKLGFKTTKRVEVFGEVEMRWG